jgi:hypothetical protein
LKTTLDLPDALVRRAKSLAARQGRPLRDFVAEAINEKLVDSANPPTAGKGNPARRDAWERWKSRLQKLPDGLLFNPEGIDDESFFRSLDEIRAEPWGSAQGISSR